MITFCSPNAKERPSQKSTPDLVTSLARASYEGALTTPETHPGRGAVVVNHNFSDRRRQDFYPLSLTVASLHFFSSGRFSVSEASELGLWS
ncbi:hypothetical protein NPIL_197641 [Nephila pilipes]|uniref:Uncharacterized protein n=1 Tax=Nephila pilipes TaxID=299642 RepID=A0A8X6UK53_NEPPI|nr:hypothetical protein NPIL_197641 [Nephila pilipes]